MLPNPYANLDYDELTYLMRGKAALLASGRLNDRQNSSDYQSICYDLRLIIEAAGAKQQGGDK